MNLLGIILIHRCRFPHEFCLMQLEETIEIFAYEDEGLRKLRISVLSSLDIFEIESDDDVIQHFEGINIIQHQNPTTLTVSKLMGKILSSNDGSLSICGQTIPLSLLDLLCRESLKVASLDVGSIRMYTWLKYILIMCYLTTYYVDILPSLPLCDSGLCVHMSAKKRMEPKYTFQV